MKRSAYIFLIIGLMKKANYRLDGNQLVITFPSKNHYILEKIHE